LNPPLRKIIHCDCDCFYAAVEMRDDPFLRGRPLAVGGRPDQRGVVATCNYEARRFGVRSAMPTSQALQRCPDLIVMPPAMEKYRVASRQILAIYRDYTELVEPLSLDEAYLDVTGAAHFNGSATLIAQDIRGRIAETVGITASAGIAPNKFIALSRVKDSAVYTLKYWQLNLCKLYMFNAEQLRLGINIVRYYSPHEH
jgi:DNA polymerase IV